MSANGSVNLLNESLASLPSHSKAKEALPPFESMEPPSFILSTALKEVTQQHPPVSPRTATRVFNSIWRDYPPSNQPLSTQEAEDLLLENDDLSSTIRAMAYGLISTIHCHTTHFTQQLRESEQRIRDQWELVAQRDEELGCLRADNIEAPTGFVPNKGRVNCVIPAEGRGLVVPRFIQRRGGGQVEMVAGRAHGEPVYVSDIYLTPD